MVDATLSYPDFHGTVTAAGGSAAWDAGPPADPPGYELLGEVGRGGMGVVFRARDLALNREVAVKLLRPGTGPGSTAAARFVEEAQVTGQLQHPGIPAVYQVGALPDGRPFLAMKLIQGRTLDELLKAGAPLDPLRVFEAICHAVGYAHAHGVIHRDLKPHNVMVGAFGEVQVMDWGLAKRIRDDDAPRHAEHQSDDSLRGTGYSELTQHGSVLGTLAYMPPEQAAGDHARVGPPADVFGLGAILCVLLTGTPPHVGETLESLYAAAAGGDTTDAFARLDGCGADPAVVALGKRCLAFDPAARPPTGDAVATEIAAIRAAADDRAKRAEVDRAAAAVRAGEGAKRRRLIQWAAAAVMVVLAVGVTVSLWQAKVARREAFDAETARANAEAAGRATDQKRAEAEAVVTFLEERVFAAARPKGRAGGLGKDVTLRDAITACLPALSDEFADQPLVEARLRHTVGNTFWYLREAATAVRHLERAGTLYAERLGPDDPLALEVASDLSNCLFDLGRHADALALRMRTLAARTLVLPADHPATLVSRIGVANSLAALDRHAEAVALQEDALGRCRRVLGPDHEDTLNSLWGVVVSLVELNRGAEAIPLIDECVSGAAGKSVDPRMIPSLMVLRLRHFQRAADPAGCRSTAVMWEKLDRPDADSLYDAACHRAVAAAMFARANQPTDATADADRAMEWLRKAVQAGYTAAAHVAQDTDLDPLRGEPEFQAIVAELTKKFPPPPKGK